jgi:3-isopropylmalate/(R)-2-methylmalate dehydratase small subunit
MDRRRVSNDIGKKPKRSNKNYKTDGILPIKLEEKTVEKLKNESGELEVDLENQILKTNLGQISFEIDTHKKKILLEGLDDISQTMQFEDRISEFEKQSKIPSVL